MKKKKKDKPRLLIDACHVILDGQTIMNMCHGDTAEVAIKTKIIVEDGPGASLLFQINDQVHERIKLGIGESFTLSHLIEIISPKVHEAFQSAGKELREDVYSQDKEEAQESGQN